VPLSDTLSQSKRIIVLFSELLGTGGVQEAGRQTARALSAIPYAQGWQLEIFSLNDLRGSQNLSSTGRAIPFYGFGRQKVRFVLAMINQGLSLRSKKLCFVLAGHPNLAPAAWGINLFSRVVKTIVMTHGVEVWKRLPILRRVALERADLVLAPSESTTSKLVQVQQINRTKILKLPWPVNPDLLGMAGTPFNLPLPTDFPQGRVILTVGRWSSSERYKGLDDLIKATSELRKSFADLHLVVVGGGDDLPRLRRLATSTGIADSVYFLDRIPQEQLAACYANAYLFALPSTGEGFGLVFLEAMAFGQPIVATACGGALEVVVDGVNGLLISPHESWCLIDALGRLLRDESLRERLGQNGAKIVRSKYGFEAFRDKLADILSDVELQPSLRTDS
jgi:phosphatidyl-myo-inositol dimannoside synthase